MKANYLQTNPNNFGLEIDAKGNIINVIFSSTKILGFLPKTLIGKSFNKIFVVNKTESFLSDLSSIKPKKAKNIEVSLSGIDKIKCNYVITIICNNSNAYSVIINNKNQQNEILEKTQIKLNTLQETVALHHQIIQATQAIILRLNTDSTIASISKGAEKLLGYKSNELINENWFLKIVNPKIYPEYQIGFKSFLASTQKTRVITTPVICKNGHVKMIAWKTSKIFFNNNLVGTIGIGKDVTEIEKKVAALKESENNFKNLAQLVQIPLSFIALDGTITFVNDAYIKEYGFTLKEIPDMKSLLTLCYSNLEERKNAIELWKTEVEILKKQKKILHKTVSINTKKGDKKTIEYSAILNDNYIFYSYLDKTAQLEKENLLIQNQEKFKRIAKNLPIAVAGCNLQDFTITFMNNKFVDDFGYEKNKIANYEIWREFIILEDKSKKERDVIMRNIVEELLNKTKNNTKLIERNILCKNGTIKKFEIGLTLDKDTIYAFFYDITERKEAEKKLTESEGRFRNLAENLPVPVISLHAEKGLTYRNQKHLELIGFDNSNVKAPQNFIENITGSHSSDNPKKDFLEKIKFLKNNKTDKPIVLKPHDLVIKCLDGVSRIFDVSETIFGKTLYAIFNDVTDQRKAASKILESEQKFKALAQNMPMAIGSYNENENTIFVNKHFTEITGYDVQEIGNIKNWYKCTQPNPKIRKAYYEHWTKVVADFRAGIIKEPPIIKAICKCKDGNFKHFSFSFSIYKSITYILIIDITETEKAKIELEKSHTELRNFASYLQNIREEERKNISREIHDELGQQLTGIKMDVSAIFRGINPQYKQHQDAFKQVLEMINHSVKTVRKISAQLRPSILDDLGLAAAIEWHAQEFYKRYDVVCVFKNELNTDKISPSIESNLFRILQESLTNIARHAEAKNVLISLQNNLNTVTLTVTDDGKGFTKNQRSSTLGLLGMKERVLMMNGEFKIQTEKGKGTIVKVIVPIK